MRLRMYADGAKEENKNDQVYVLNTYKCRLISTLSFFHPILGARPEAHTLSTINRDNISRRQFVEKCAGQTTKSLNIIFLSRRKKERKIWL
jgi:hypothetical protein